MRRNAWLSVALGCAVVVAACAGPAAAPGRPTVAAAFYAVAFVARGVAGPDAVVREVAPAGADPHDIELSPRDVETIREADVVVFLSGGFQPAVEEAVSRPSAFDVRETVLNGRNGDVGDPHFWLDPVRMADLAGAVADRLAAADPSDASAYRARAQSLAARLRALDRSYSSELASCRRREIFTSHSAFRYLAARYRLREIAAVGPRAEGEPTPRRIAEVADLVRRHRATTVFAEPKLSKVAQTLAREAGVRTDVLDPLESVKAPDTYLTVMRRNLTALRHALDCV